MSRPELMTIYGKHAVLEALAFKERIVLRLWVAGEVEDLVKKAAAKRNVKVESLSNNNWPSGLSREVVHQGFVAQIDTSLLYSSYADFLSNIDLDKKPAVAVLAEIQDPHNVGAIIRSAAGFGLSAIFIPEHNQVDLTGTVIKSSAGMVFKLPIIKIGNVNQTLLDLKEAGFWIYGLDGSGKNNLATEDFTTPAAFVLGNEGLGLRQKTAEGCDILLKIQLDPKCESLNVSTAAAVTFFKWANRKSL